VLTGYDRFGTMNNFSVSTFLDLFSDLPFTTTKKTVAVNAHETYRCQSDEVGLCVHVDLPGVKRPDLSVEMNGPVLCIKSARDGKKSTRKYTISSDFDPKTVEARLEDGVLAVKFARMSSAQVAGAVKVEVK